MRADPQPSSVRCTSCGIAKPRSDYSMKPDGLRWYSSCDRCRKDYVACLNKLLDNTAFAHGRMSK